MKVLFKLGREITAKEFLAPIEWCRYYENDDGLWADDGMAAVVANLDDTQEAEAAFEQLAGKPGKMLIGWRTYTSSALWALMEGGFILYDGMRGAFNKHQVGWDMAPALRGANVVGFASTYLNQVPDLRIWDEEEERLHLIPWALGARIIALPRPEGWEPPQRSEDEDLGAAGEILAAARKQNKR